MNEIRKLLQNRLQNVSLVLRTIAIVFIICVAFGGVVVAAVNSREPITVSERHIDFPVITSVSISNVTEISADLYIRGKNFSSDADVLLDFGYQAVVAVLDNQNIFVRVDILNLPVVAYAYPDVSIIVRNGGVLASNEYILTGIPRLDMEKTIVHNTDWLPRGVDFLTIGNGDEGDFAFTNINSRESFEYSYGQGQRLFKFSTQFSADGVLFGIQAENRTPLFTFRQEQSAAGDTLLSFEDIVLLMLDYDDWWLITDTQYSKSPQAVAATFRYMEDTINRIDSSLVNRIVIQAYNQWIYYFVINHFQFSAFIYNLSDSVYDEEIVDFLSTTGIAAVHASVDRMTTEFLGILSDIGVLAFVDLSLDEDRGQLEISEFISNLTHDDFMVLISLRKLESEEHYDAPVEVDETDEFDESEGVVEVDTADGVGEFYEINKEMLMQFARLGLRYVLDIDFYTSYVAVIVGRTVIYENVSDEQVEFRNVIEGRLVDIASGSYLNPVAKISIDDRAYSPDAPGLNIVVFNMRTGLIEDTAVFDIHTQTAD